MDPESIAWALILFGIAALVWLFLIITKRK